VQAVNFRQLSRKAQSGIAHRTSIQTRHGETLASFIP
jgi:hypothetical protein